MDRFCASLPVPMSNHPIALLSYWDEHEFGALRKKSTARRPPPGRGRSAEGPVLVWGGEGAYCIEQL